MKFSYDLISKIFQVLKLGKTEKSFVFPFPTFLLLLVPLLIFPFFFYFDFLSFYRNNSLKSLRVLEMLLWPKCHFDWNKKSFARDGLHVARWCKKGGNRNKWQQIYEVLPCKFMWRKIKAVLRVYLCGWTLIHDRAAKVPFPLLAQELSEL